MYCAAGTIKQIMLKEFYVLPLLPLLKKSPKPNSCFGTAFFSAS